MEIWETEMLQMCNFTSAAAATFQQVSHRGSSYWMALLASAAIIMTVLNLFFPTISPAAAPQGGCQQTLQQEQNYFCPVKVFVMLTVPQKAHPREEHTTNWGDIKTKKIYSNRNTITEFPSCIPQSFKTHCALRALRNSKVRTFNIKKVTQMGWLFK